MKLSYQKWKEICRYGLLPTYAWCKQFREECQTSPESKAEYDNMKELLKLKRDNDELRKEVAFLKKAAAFFAKEID